MKNREIKTEDNGGGKVGQSVEQKNVAYKIGKYLVIGIAAILVLLLLFSCEKEEFIDTCRCDEFKYELRDKPNKKEKEWILIDVRPLGCFEEENYRDGDYFYKIKCERNTYRLR